MDKRAEVFGQWRVAHVVECGRLAALPTREIPRSAREEILAGQAARLG